MKIAQVGLSVAALVLVGSLLAMSISGYATGDFGVLYLSVAILAALLPISVALYKDGDIFSPLALIGLALLWATSLRAFYVYFGGSRANFLMMGQDWGGVFQYSIISVLGVICICGGYLTASRRVPLERIRLVTSHPPIARVVVLALVCAAVGVIGAMMFVQRENISLSGDLLSLSVKRPGKFIDDDGNVRYGVGIEYYIGTFSQYGLLLLVAALLNRRKMDLRRHGPLLGILFALTCVVPFLASVRSAIIVPLIACGIMLYYFGKLKMSTILPIAAVSILVIVGMANLRAVNQDNLSRYGNVVDAVLGSGNGPDLIRTSGIMAKSDELSIRLNGSSYASLIVAPIPRNIWPAKPATSLGPWVKGTLYGQTVRNNGWPPGMIAESYVNFGLVGVPVIMWVFGWALGVLYNSVKPLLGVSFIVTLLYASVIWRLGFGAIGLNFTQGLMQALIFAVPIGILALLSFDRRPVKQVGQQFAR